MPRAPRAFVLYKFKGNYVMTKPNFIDLWDAYPKNKTAEEAYAIAGGDIQQAYLDNPIDYANACAVRMSIACNLGGMIIHSGDSIDTGYRLKGKILDYETLPGRNYYAYYLRVIDMINFLEKRLGAPSTRLKLLQARKADTHTFRGRKGVMIYKIAWSDASGHVALWDGNNFANTDVTKDNYFKEQNLLEILFWDLP